MHIASNRAIPTGPLVGRFECTQLQIVRFQLVHLLACLKARPFKMRFGATLRTVLRHDCMTGKNHAIFPIPRVGTVAIVNGARPLLVMIGPGAMLRRWMIGVRSLNPPFLDSHKPIGKKMGSLDKPLRALTRNLAY